MKSIKFRVRSRNANILILINLRIYELICYIGCNDELSDKKVAFPFISSCGKVEEERRELKGRF